MGQTPLWMSIVGWIVTLAAAIIPAIIAGKQQSKMKVDITDLKKAQAASIDKFQFWGERSSLLQDLEQFEKALDNRVNGNSTLSSLSRLLVRVESYAKRLHFSEDEKLIISSLGEKVAHALDSHSAEPLKLNSSDLEKVKVILEKGDYLQ